MNSGSPSRIQFSTDEVRLLNESQHYADALALAEKTKNSFVQSRTRSGLVALYFEMAYAHYFLSNYTQALLKIKVALKLSTTSDDLRLVGSLRNLSGLILQQLGRLNDAAEEHMQAYAFRKHLNQYDQIALSLINLGLVHLLKGNLREAADQFEKATDYAVKYNSRELQSKTKLNHVLVLVLQGYFREAKAIITTSFEGSSDPFVISRVCHRDGFRNACLVHRVEAGALLSRSLELARQMNDNRFVAVCLEYLGLNEYFAGNYSKAREYYDQVLAMPEPTASAVAQTLRMLTDVEIAEGNWDAAKTTAARAELAINKISERIELGALWRAYGAIHTHDNDHARARENFEKSIDLLRQLGARYELALSHFDAGRSEAYSAGQQIEHLNQAKALFVDMEVPKRVAQVETAIRKHAIQSISESRNGKSKLTVKASAVQVPVIIAESAAMKKIVALADRIKDNNMNVLITGETGTGKDLLAEYIHKSSLRAGKPFVVVNCAAIPEAMLEAELFGYKKGSYTGAVNDKPGLIETANGGSFFLNEIGEAGIAVQTKLLQVIEEKAVRRLGDNESIKIDVRFIAATNQNLRERIEKGEFRDDLFYRLNERPIHLPPLRERAEDAVALLQLLFTKRGIELNGDLGRVEDSLRSYSWPGNVRELIAIVNRVVSNHEADGADNLLDLLNSELDMESPDSEERHHLLQIVAKHGGNKTRAAQELGIPVTTLRSRLNKFNL